MAAPGKTAIERELKRLVVMPRTPYLVSLHTTIRDEKCGRKQFVEVSNRLLRLLCEYALDSLPHREKEVVTPTGGTFKGAELAKPVCGVSILRSGECMEAALRSTVPDVSIGKILIQRDESSAGKEAHLYYSKLPASIVDAHVVLLDPMVGTGGSCLAAIKVLLELGVREENITFVNLVSSPEGLRVIAKAHPGITTVTSMVDDSLNEDKYLVPGLGDFGDRYFGTTASLEHVKNTGN
jgi:uracil phosphoribosyltransferase